METGKIKSIIIHFLVYATPVIVALLICNSIAANSMKADITVYTAENEILEFEGAENFIAVAEEEPYISFDHNGQHYEFRNATVENMSQTSNFQKWLSNK